MLAAAMVMLAGCSGISTKPSGFLSSYDQMKPVKPGNQSLFYVDQAAGEYHAIIIDPVCFETNAAAKLKPELQTCLRSKLTRRAQNVFAEKFQIVNTPGPGVLRLRIAVDDIKRGNPYVNLLTTAAVFVPLDMGGISVEMEAVDSVTGTRVAALLDKRQGFPLTPYGFFGSYVPSGHAKFGFTCLSEAMLKMISPARPEIAQNDMPLPK